MDQQVAIQSIDDLLLPFIRAGDETESEKLLSSLIREHAEPIIRGIIKHKLRVSLNDFEGSRQNQDALEIAGDVCAVILADLRNLKRDPARRSIGGLHNYVAIKTYSACADYFRAKNPQRWRLRGMLRHQLKQNQKFSIWQNEHQRWLCGLRAWRVERPREVYSDKLQQVLDDPHAKLNNPESCVADTQRAQPAEMLNGIFEYVGHPIDFNQLVTIVAELWGIKDHPVESYDHDDGTKERLADTAAGVDAVVEQRSYLYRLWLEVCQLPTLQRSALLLNLRDAQEGSVIAFIPHLGIASKEEIAEMLSMSAEQFSEIWNELPLDDASIARLLGVTRQQVINLRKTARERLARRMKAIEKNAGGNK